MVLASAWRLPVWGSSDQTFYIVIIMTHPKHWEQNAGNGASKYFILYYHEDCLSFILLQ
jgi:hypothetical protein